MLISSTKNISRHWISTKDINLRELLKLESEFQSNKEVTFNLSTNRTQKAGDDILSTPGMISQMNDETCKYVNSFLPKDYSTVTSKVVCQHKAPLSLGKHFLIQGKVKDIQGQKAIFHVLCLSEESKIIGDAEISIQVIKHK